MKIVNFNCAKCGAELDKPIDELGVYKCKYCGHDNFIEENYDVNYVSTHGTKHIKDFIVEKKVEARNYLSNKNYEMAFKTYYLLFEYIPKDIEVLEGLMKSYTEDFSVDKAKFISSTLSYDTFYSIYKDVQTDIDKRNYFINNYDKLVNISIANEFIHSICAFFLIIAVMLILFFFIIAIRKVFYFSFLMQ